MTALGAKRFYKTAAISCSTGGYAVELDGKPIRTPAKHAFVLPEEALALAAAEEWQMQGETIRPATMPLTKLANTAIDGVEPRRHEVATDILRFAGSDLLCYRATEPAELAARQAAVWDPVLAWSASELNAPFKSGHGLRHVPQPAASLDAIAAVVERLDTFALTAVHTIAALTSSAILSLAHIFVRLTLAETWDAASVDENWQARRWGQDSEAERRRADIRDDIAAASRFYRLSRRPASENDPPSGNAPIEIGCFAESGRNGVPKPLPPSGQ